MKLRISFISIILVLAIISGTFAVVSDSNLKSGTIDNMRVVSENKNGLIVSWFPTKVGLVDKEYNINIQNLENKQKNVDIDVFFKAITKDIDTILSGSAQLSYLTDLTKVLDNYSTTCTNKQVTLSQGQPNQTTKTIKECTTQNNPTTINYKGFKAYPTNEVRDKTKQEIILKKTNENGKIILPANDLISLNLKFKTRVLAKDDGTFGNDGSIGLLLDGVSYHPDFNVSYNKRYVINITANDAINTNFTHNISLAITGNSTEIGSGMVIKADNNVLACNFLHLVFDDTLELSREIEGCNSSNVRIYFRNQANLTRNQTAPKNYSIYYHPINAQNDPQPPRDWSSIWLLGSTHFDDGQNDTLYEFDNATQGNSTWLNVSGNGFVELIGEDDPNDGCLVGRDITNTTESNIAVEFLLKRANAYSNQAGNKAFGLNDRPCHTSPNSLANGFFLKDSPAGLENNFSARSASSGVLTSSTLEMGRPDQETWQLVSVNRTISTSTLNITGFFVTNNPSRIIHENVSTNVPNSTIPIKPLFKSERFAGVADFNIDEIRIIQLVANIPFYTFTQQNITMDRVMLNNPPDNLSNFSNKHVFNATLIDSDGLINVTLYHNISGNWVANQTVIISGAQNSTNFLVTRIPPGRYVWNIQECDINNVCIQAINNFTFRVEPNPPVKVNVRACTAGEMENAANTYNGACKGTYPAVCSNNQSDDLLSCDADGFETQTYDRNKFTGIHVQVGNTSITDCNNITEVFLCRELWASSRNLQNCLIAVGANGNASYSTVTTACPDTASNSGIVCTNVTSLESWTCSSFFGTTGTKAVARTELSKSTMGDPQTLMTDVLFFNVTYITN